MPELREIRFDIVDWPGGELAGHSELSVDSAADPTATPPAGYSAEQVRAAANDAAGALARLALAIAPLIAAEAREHGCDQTVGVGADARVEPLCGLTLNGVEIGKSPDGAHELWLVVRTERVQEWVTRLAAWLAATQN